jgi:hypothetical protein
VPANSNILVIALADRLGVASSTLASQLVSLPDDLCTAWDSVGVHPASALEIWTYPGLPAMGLLTSDAGTAIDLGPAVRRSAFDARSQISIFTACLSSESSH